MNMNTYSANRIPTQDQLTAHVAACVAERNAACAIVHWQFSLDKARVKLDRHYQKIRVTNSSDSALVAVAGIRAGGLMPRSGRSV